MYIELKIKLFLRNVLLLTQTSDMMVRIGFCTLVIDQALEDFEVFSFWCYVVAYEHTISSIH